MEMGVIFKLAIRNMRRRKARYILTTITLVIGVALFGGILIARDSFRVMFIKDIDNRMGTADILVRKNETRDGWFRPSEVKDIENLPHVDYVSYRIAGYSVYSSWTLHGNQLYNSTRTAVYGIDIEDRDEQELGGKPYILDSAVDGNTIEKILEKGIREFGKNTIVITESLKIKLGRDFEAGDEIWILPIEYYKIIGMDQKLVSADTGLWPKYTVAAIIRDLGEARDFDPETPSTYESPSSGPCLFANIDTAHKLVDGIVNHFGFYNLVAVGVDDVNNIKGVVDDIKDKLGDRWVEADLKTNTIEDINNSVDMMMTILLMFAIVALILSIILILNIFNIIKEEQEYETGMLQAVGASKSETFKMFLIQGVVMGIIGAIIGTICSFFMSYLIFYMTVESLKNLPGEFGQMFAQTEFEIILNPQTLAITMSVGVISCILAAIYPSWKASRKPLIECLNPLAHKAEREKKHHRRKILYILLSLSLIAYGSWLLFTVVGGYGPSQNGNESLTESTASIIAPTLILLGIIGLSAIFVGPISKGFIKLFGPYLKHTKLLTRKNVLRHRKRTVLTFSMIALTVSYLVSVSVLMGSFREGVHTTVNDVMGCDIRIFAQNTPQSFEDDLKDIDGVADVMGVSHRNVQIFDEDSNKWIGHSSLEKKYDKSITVHIFDPKKVEKHMTETVIYEPNGMTLKDMMHEIKKENTMIITEKEADDFNLDVDDKALVRFSLGIMFPSYDALQAYDTENAKEVNQDEEMKVIAVVEKFQGFATGQIIGQEEGAYNIFISWQTYEKIARNNLPGGNTDIIFRQKPQSGYDDIDLYYPKWFNFSDVYPILKNIKGIDYYTTRMDYSSPSFNLNTTFASFPTDLDHINFNSSVVGIRTNSSGNIANDDHFGKSILLKKSEAYTGSTMEELLFNNSENVCVVDETYIKNMRRYDSAFGIGSNITIFPQMTDPNPITIVTGGNNPFIYPPAYTEVGLKNGTQAGAIAGFQTSDNNYINFTSDDKNNLEFNISINLGGYLLSSPYFINPINITIESFVNSTISNLDLEVYNYIENSFDYLGSLNSTIEDNNTFYFNPDILPLSYINIETGEIKFRIIGNNSTFSNNYKLSINKLDFQVARSTYSIDPNTWPNYTVIGIIQDPLLYSTERYNWQAGYEVGYDIAQTQNTVYINYEKARSQVYVDYKGSQDNGSYDKVTHVFIHCKSVDDIAKTASQLRNALGSNWTVLDLKTGSPAIPIDSLAFRLNVFDWYIWVDEGEDDEKVLDEITNYMEDHGYIVLFAFTNSYITQIFESLVDLITLVMNGILVFAIIIAMIGLALHCLLTTMARRREIGMLRSIGLNKKGVIRTISGETLVVAFLGTIIGILSGLLIGFLMVSSIPDTGFLTVTLTIPWLIIGLLILTTVVTAILSSRYPSKWAANINIIDAVRTR